MKTIIQSILALPCRAIAILATAGCAFASIALAADPVTGGPVKGEVTIQAGQAAAFLDALNTIANSGHDERVPQGSAADKVIHRPSDFSGEVQLALARDIAAFTKVKNDLETINADLRNQFQKLTTDGHTTQDEKGNTKFDTEGSKKVAEINQASGLAGAALVKVPVTYFYEVDFKVESNPGLAAALGMLETSTPSLVILKKPSDSK